MSQPYLTELLMQPLENNVPTPACDLCGSHRIVTDIYSGEEVCTGCGYVVNDVVFISPKSSKEDNWWYGYKPRYSTHDMGLSTRIMGKKDAFGSPLKQATLRRMRQLQRRDRMTSTTESMDRNLSAAMSEMDRLCTALNLPQRVKEKSSLLYRRALANDLIRGRSIDAFVAASIFLACRLMGVPRLLKTVSHESKREKREVGLMYRFMLKELNIKPPVDTPFKYIPRIVTAVNAPRSVEKTASELITRAIPSRVVAGKDPVGVAGAAVYLASQIEGVPLIQARISEAAGVTGITLRNRYRELKQVLDEVESA